MHGENLLVNDRSNWQAVEAIRKCLPQLDVVASLALVVEAVDAIDGSALVVAAEDEEIFRVLDLVCQQQTDGLEGLLASIYVVAEEEVVGLWWEAAILEKAQQVVVLSVDIAANLLSSSASLVACTSPPTHLDRRLELEEYGLGDEDLASLGAQVSYFSLKKLNLLSRPAAADFEESVDDGIEVHVVLVRHDRRWVKGRRRESSGACSRSGIGCAPREWLYA